MKPTIPYRYDSISTYIYNCHTGRDGCSGGNTYNDIDCPVDEHSRQALLKAGIDPVSLAVVGCSYFAVVVVVVVVIVDFRCCT